MAKFNLLFNIGYGNMDWDWETEAKSWKEARDLWLKREKGTWKGDSVLANPKNLRAVKIN